MIFTKKSRRIFSEWVKDFECAPAIAEIDISELKAARDGDDIKMTFISEIATLALGALSLDDNHPSLIKESKLILAEIKTQYDLQVKDSFLIITKKRSSKK